MVTGIMRYVKHNYGVVKHNMRVFPMVQNLPFVEHGSSEKPCIPHRTESIQLRREDIGCKWKMESTLPSTFSARNVTFKLKRG
jgi:hypothetical protein